MKNFLNGIIYSISYFTTLPLKCKKFEANKSFYKGVVYGLPLSGLILGIISVGLYTILPFPPLYKAILLSIIYLFLYGFIHLEAISDTIDGYFASLSGKDVYKIMKEPQVGAIGAIGTFCFVLLKVLALTFLLYYGCYITIILALIVSRASIFFALELEFHKHSSFILLLQDAFTPPLWFKLLLLPLSIFTKFILNILKKHLGFLNGDTLGFTIELQELIYLNIGILVWL
jgi:adenosylcobinamide-GDP ribazoletransferase